MYKVDLNSDLGESFGRYTIGNDDKIIPLISSANIACGFDDDRDRANEGGRDSDWCAPGISGSDGIWT